MSNRHDEQIDRLLGALHRRVEAGSSGECLDPEALAAWMDGRLGGPALARAEAHAAACARCQALVAAMVRTADAGLEGRGGASPVRSGFWRMLPWAAPLTAAATAAALYVAVRPEPGRAPQPEPFRTAAEREVTAVPGEPARPEADAAASPPSRNSETATGARPQAAPAASPAERRDTIGGAGARARQEQGRQQFLARDAAQAPSGAVAASTPAPPPPPALPESRELKDVMKPGELPPVTEQVQVVSPPEPPAGAKPVTSAYAQRSAARGAAPAEALEERVMVLPVIATPDPSVLWRIMSGRVVQISRDGGRTWATRDVGVPVTLSAGAAPSTDVCWMVGRQGAVIRTTNSRTWQRIAFPERADLVSITAAGADAATITTADGRRFTTTDGGRTWQPERR